MGGSSSRELSRRGSKRRRKKEQVQRTGQQEVLPSSHSFNISETRHFGYDGHDAMTYVDNQSGFYSVNRNDFDHPKGEDVVGKFGVNFENPNGFLERPSSVNHRYEERPLIRPIRRHHSFNENRFQFQNVQGTMNDFGSSRIRCNSLIDLNDKSSLFEGQFMGNRFTNFSNYNLPEQNHRFGKTTVHNSSRYATQISVGHGGIKRNSCDGYSDEGSKGDSSNGACEEMFLDSPSKPRVKRRQSDENQSVDCLSGDDINRIENERSHSVLSIHSNTTSDSAGSDIARSLSNEPCGALDILSFPTEWSSCAFNKTGYVNVSFSSPEGRSVQNYFERTCRSKDCFLSICSIMRIENPFLHTLYLLKKEEMTVRNGHVDELFLYHGTKKRHMLNICENNLDWRKYSKMHRFGKGVSFSPSVMYSSHYSDERACDKIVMLFKVLVSKSIVGWPEMNIPVDVEGVSYDTSIKEDASVIVKYEDNEFYPLYKIMYNKV